MKSSSAYLTLGLATALALVACGQEPLDEPEPNLQNVIEWPEADQQAASKSPNVFRVAVSDWFDQYGEDGVIKREWLEDTVSVALAKSRQSKIESMLADRDLNYDGNLSAEELSLPRLPEYNQLSEARLVSFLEDQPTQDLDGDGALSGQELHMAIESTMEKTETFGVPRNAFSIFVFDQNKDGALTVAEFEAGFSRWIEEHPVPVDAKPERRVVSRRSPNPRRGGP